MKATRNNHTYYIKTNNRGTKHFPPYVYPFEWNNYRFFAHRDYTLGVYKPEYDVTERITGLSLGILSGTPQEAINAAIEKLELKGLDGLRDSIAKGVELVISYAKNNRGSKPK